MKIKIFLACILILNFSISFGQLRNYNYEREVKGISQTWHKIVLPGDIFSKISHDLSDIRIIGINKSNDSIEAPYILRLNADKFSQSEIQFKLINQSRNQMGYFYSFELPQPQYINQITLDFKQQNFDWKVRLEGSQDQKEWFTITNNYRILSIENNLTDYKFTTISFPKSQYHFFRLLIKSDEKPELLAVKLFEQKITGGIYKNYTAKKAVISEDKNLKQTIIEVTLPIPVPVSYFKIFVQDKYDYYRPINISYLEDSIKTPNGWIYNYNTITSGTLTSLENNEFKFRNVISSKFKIIISNYDNQQLKIDSVSVKGNVYELLVRFTEYAKYYLVYGNPGASRPDYDINNFINKIPASITEVTLGNEQSNYKSGEKESTPLFQNKLWLWSILVIIIVLLGWFTLKMFNKK